MESAKITFEEVYALYPQNVETAKSEISENVIVPKSVEVAVYNISGITEIKIRSEQGRAFSRVKKQLQNYFSKYLLIGPNQSIQERLVEALTHKHLTISTAESMTGGMIASMITGVSNSSVILKESFIVYSNEAKATILGVDPKLIDSEGVVSADVAKAMADKLYSKTKRDICVSVTGIAGPSTDERETPVGTVFIGIYYRGESTVMECHFQGSRNQIRQQASMTAIAAVLNILKEYTTS